MAMTMNYDHNLNLFKSMHDHHDHGLISMTVTIDNKRLRKGTNYSVCLSTWSTMTMTMTKTKTKTMTMTNY